MKKTLSLILALLMSASCAATIFADEEVVATSAIAEEVTEEAAEEVAEEEAETPYDLAVKFLVNKKIMQGKGETEDGEIILGVADPVKRYEMAIFTGRIATGWTTNDEWMNGTSNATSFTDLEGSGAMDALGVLSYVNQKDIIKGYPDGTFKPENTVSYRDALAMVVRTLGYTGLEYPWEIIEKAVTLGLTKDISGVAYTDPINRGVAAQIMYNALFEATTSKGTKLAMDSFNVEYGWENIIVTADDVAVYELGDKTTKDGKGIVAFKMLDKKTGELSDDVYYVNADIDGDKVADLTFGNVYNALFEIDADEEYVDMIGAIKYEPEVIENKGLTDDEGVAYADADFIGAYLKNYTLLEKYNVKNLSKDTLYNDEIIVVGEANEKVAIEWKNASNYAINWTTGDILTYDADKNEYTTVWYYNSDYDTYFRYKKNEVTIDKELEIAGIEIMDDEDLETLKKNIKTATESKWEEHDGYKWVESVANTAYATLTAYDLDDDGLADYAQYEAYTFDKFEGIKGDGDAKLCGDCDNLQSYKFANNSKYYPIAGTCDHFKAADDRTYTLNEITEGYTGYVIYGVDEAKNEITIVKEIPEYGKNTDEDSYVATGIVRGLDASGKQVTIGNDKVSFDYDILDGTKFPKAGDNAKQYVTEMFNSLFNQFVEYVVVDGKLVRIDTKGGSSTNYIVVEDYYGIDSDGYIVISGYTTDDLKLTTMRIGAFDGWKTGSGFFYNEEQMEEYFEKGAVYQITSTDTTEKNGDVYYVTCIGNNDKDGEIEALKAFAVEDATVKVVDNYRVTTYVNADGETKNETKRLADGQKYVVIGDVTNQALGEFMPIYTFKGKLPASWYVTGDLLVKNDDLYVICNVTEVNGFNFDTYATGYVVLRENFMKTAKFDGYGSDYYVYGAATYEVEAFNLLTGKNDDYAASTNFDLDAYEIYNTIDKTIVSDKAKTWTEFWANAQGAYADSAESNRIKTGDPDYIFAHVPVTEADFANKETFSKNIVSGMLALTGKYDDLITGDYRTWELELDKNGNITKFDEFKWADDVAKDTYEVKAYVIYDVKAAGCVVYVDVNNYVKVNDEPKDTVDASNKIKVGDDAYVSATAGLDIKTTGNNVVDTVTLDTLTFYFSGDAIANDEHRSIDVDNYHFGEADACKVEDWNVKAGSAWVSGSEEVKLAELHNGSIATDLYDETHDCEDVDCKLVKEVTIALGDEKITLKDQWSRVRVTFNAYEHNDAGNVIPTGSYDLTVAIQYDATKKAVTGFKFEDNADVATQIVGNLKTEVK